MYFGPSVEDYADAGFDLSSAESIEPRCATDSVIQEACEARWEDDGGDSGGSSGTESPSAPDRPSEPKPSPANEPTKENPPKEDTTTPPTGPTSGIQFVSVMLSSCVLGVSTVLLM